MALGTIPPVYNGEDLEIIDAKPYPWQIDLMNILNTWPNDREVIWIYDPEGGRGKSMMTKYLIYKQIACLMTFDNPRDLAHIRQKYKERNVVIVDFTRSVSNNTDMPGLYSLIEQLKIGCFNAPKWDSDTILTRIPHIIFFSNYLPNPKYLSWDRWAIHAITSYNGSLKRLTIDQVNAYVKDFWNWYDMTHFMPCSEKEKKLYNKWKLNKYLMYPALFKQQKALYKPSQILISHIEQNIRNIEIDYENYNYDHFEPLTEELNYSDDEN